ncbi:MAG: IS66 family transposase [Alphaproteobacteria bacterium]
MAILSDMMTVDLPDTVDALQRGQQAEDKAAGLEQLLAARTARVEHLEQLLKALRQALYGRKSEKADPDQYELAIEDLETAVARTQAEEEADGLSGTSCDKAKPRKRNLGALPAHLPRIEEVIEPDSLDCPCGCKLHKIGEDVSERLDVIPAQFRVIVTRRPRYACRSCTDGVTQASARAHVIAGGLPTEALIAHVVTSKYADHLPLYRQAQIYARQGIELDRSTLADWVGRAAFELRPIHDALLAHIKRADRLFMDETRLPVLDPGRGKTKTGWLWALTRDDRPFGGNDPPAVVFRYAPGRGKEHPEAMLQGFAGRLQVDGYGAYKHLAVATGDRPALTLVYCWAHARRKLVELTRTGPHSVAEEGIRMIADLYHIEAGLKGQSPADRLAARQAHSKPVLEEFQAWLTRNRARSSTKSPLGGALKYIANHWDGLSRFVNDGQLDLDNNPVERNIRPIALTRKNALFAGHDTGAQNHAMLASLIETCKLNAINPQAWLTQTLTALANGHKQSDILDLMPWQFSPNPLR